MYIFGKNNNHLIKNNYKATFSLPQKVKLISKPILKSACGSDFIICLTQDLKTYCYFQSAIHNIDFKQDLKIIDIQTQQNLILFVTQEGELYATQFLAEKIINDCLRPKPVRLTLPFSSQKQKVIKQIKMVDEYIFLKMQNNQIAHFRKNDWMQTKSFSDPKLLLISKTYDIVDISFIKGTFYFLTKQGGLYSASQNQFSSSFKKIQLKQKLRKINSSKSQLFGINQTGEIVKIQISNYKGKIQRLWKISAKFSDLMIGQGNYYGITENQQAWVWGKNSHGQLGLSDYEPRNILYPLVSLENFYIKNFFIGQNYVCCIVDDTKTRDLIQQKQKDSVKSSFRQMKSFSTQNNFLQCKDSLNQTDQFLMPIRYTEEQSKGSLTEHDESHSGLGSLAKKKEKENKDNLLRKSILKSTKKSNQRESFKTSLKNQNTFSKVSNKKVGENSDRKSMDKSVRSIPRSVISNSKSQVSNSKLTPKSMTGNKSLFKMQKEKNQTKNDHKEYQSHNSCSKSHKIQQIISYKGSNTDQVIRESELKNLHKQCRQNLETKLKEQEIKYKENLNALSEAYKLQKQRLQGVIDSLQNQLKSKIQENKDLYELLTDKNVTISDITQKIQLLQSAIEQHEKALTARDNEAEQFYLREKEYQLHIEKLQSQVQKMMQVLNFNQRNKQTELYKKQMQRMSAEVKSRIEDEKQYYKERIACLQKKFDEQRNIYDLQIRKLNEQISSLKSQNSSLLQKMNAKPTINKFSIDTSGLENNSSQFIESPTFHTLEMKHNIKRQIQQNYLLNESQLTLQDHVNQDQRIPLQQSNGQCINLNSLQKKYQQDFITKKNSRSNNFFNKSYLQNDQNNFEGKSQSQVKQILSKIEVTKSYISKSANKLFNILENQKV